LSEEHLKSVHVLQHEIIDSVQSVYVSLEETCVFDRCLLEQMLGRYLWEPEQGLTVMRCKGKFNGVNTQG